MFGKAGLGGLMKQAQQMQENMKKAQAKLAETEDLVLAAINAASEKAEETTNKTMGAFTQGLPAGMGDFFR